MLGGHPDTTPPKELSRLHTMWAGALLTKAFRHKLWVYDVVSCLVGLHHMKAAVATAEGENTGAGIRPQCLLLKMTIIHKVEHAPIIQGAVRACLLKAVLSCSWVASLRSCPELSACMLPVRSNDSFSIFFITLTRPVESLSSHFTIMSIDVFFEFKGLKRRSEVRDQFFTWVAVLRVEAHSSDNPFSYKENQSESVSP